MIGAARNGWTRWRGADSDVGIAKVLLSAIVEEALERLAYVRRLRQALSASEQQRQACEREAVAARLNASFLLEELKQEGRLIENLRQRYAQSSERNRELAKELAAARAHAEQVEASFVGTHCTKCGSEALDFRKEGEEFLCIQCAVDRAEAKGREAAVADKNHRLIVELSRQLRVREAYQFDLERELDVLSKKVQVEEEVEPANSTRRTLPPGADVLELAEAANG